MVVGNRILLAEQDHTIRREIRCLLYEAGFQITSVKNGSEAQQFCSRCSFDLAILNAHLPDVSGILLCRHVCAVSQTPVLLITAQGNDQEILDGLEAGAADIIMEPVRSYELVARVRTVLKRTSSPLSLPGWILQRGELLLDLRSRSLTKAGDKITLTPTELRLLSCFMRNPGVTLSKEDLLVRVWGFRDVSGDFNLVDTAIKRLRRTVEDDPKNPCYIHTVWGEGYCFALPD